MKADEEIEALAKRIEELEAKLREAEERVLRLLSRIEEDELQIREWRETAVRVEERAETAERERDEARAALESAAGAFVSVWAALGDRLLARGPLARAYAADVSRKCRDAERACRAALGEKP